MKKLILTLCLSLLAANAWAVATPTATATATATPVPTPIIRPHQWNGITDNQGNTAVVTAGALNVTGGNITPGTNGFFANPENIVPRGTGNIWVVDCISGGSDSNNGLSPAHPFATIDHANSVAGDGTNDVIYVEDMSNDATGSLVDNGCVENVVISKQGISLLCGFVNTEQYGPCAIYPTSGVPITVTGSQVLISGFAPYAPDTSPSVLIKNLGVQLQYMNAGSAAGPAYKYDASLAGGAGLGGEILRNSFAIFSTNGVVLDNGTAPGHQIEIEMDDVSFFGNSGADVLGVDTAVSGSILGFSFLIRRGQFDDLNKAVYIDLSADTTYTSPGSIEARFTTDQLTFGNVKIPSMSWLQGSKPTGDKGSAVPTTTNTLISSHITGSAQKIFTASGDIDITDISLASNATGLAGGTAFELTTDNTSGALTLCSTAVAGLGANGSKDCVQNATVTKFTPFRLLSGKSILADCTVAPCTGAGTVTVNLFATRAAPYASFQNIALP